MRIIHFDRSKEIPIVDALVFGRTKHERVRLVFDSGCGTTQIHVGVVRSIGYSDKDSKQITSVQGASGEKQDGFLLKIQELQLFGISFANMNVAAHDFGHFSRYGIDGLLGFDVIKQLKFKLDGPEGLLKIY